MSADYHLQGWTESRPGGMMTKKGLLTGAIIDQNIPTKTWFIVFNNPEIESIENLASREDALNAYCREMKRMFNV